MRQGLYVQWRGALGKADGLSVGGSGRLPCGGQFCVGSRFCGVI
jgi:hypothetical protein